MTTNGTHTEHGPWCGVNPQTDCDKCKPRTIKLREMEAVERMLKIMGMPVPIIGELVWLYLEEMIEERIQKIAERAARKLLQSFRIYLPKDES